MAIVFIKGYRVMWLSRLRERRPDAPAWSGRRGWALLDAVAWPMAWAVVVARVDKAGLVGALVFVISAFVVVARAHRAVFENHRYFFTASRWLWRLVLLGVFGWLLKLALHA